MHAISFWLKNCISFSTPVFYVKLNEVSKAVLLLCHLRRNPIFEIRCNAKIAKVSTTKQHKTVLVEE